MRCHICNAVLSAEETQYNVKYEGEKYGPYDPCGRCLSIIDEAFEDPLEEEEIDELLDEDSLYNEMVEQIFLEQSP